MAATTSLAGTQLGTVVAAFNGGFRLSDPSHNGYYSEGRTIRTLVPGKASLVLRTDGTAEVGTWSQEVQMSPDVASVRQNLLPLVDHGQVNPTCATGGPAEWGSTVGQAAYIHRSGFGVTATGVEIYVGGPALSVCTLGTILAGRRRRARHGARHQSDLGQRLLLPRPAGRPTPGFPALPHRAGVPPALPLADES